MLGTRKHASALVIVAAALLFGASAAFAAKPTSSPPSANEHAYKTPPDQTLNDHPSGKDRSVEPGGSGTQGKAVSDPDGMTNGGADKPGQVGGFDTDKDGNNGCGNDDDFEDDNNGWCGHHPKKTTVESGGEAVVQGEVFERSSGSGSAAVLGEVAVPARVATPAVEGEALPRTGADVVGLTARALALILSGLLLVGVTYRRRRPVAVAAPVAGAAGGAPVEWSVLAVVAAGAVLKAAGRRAK